MGSGFGSGLGSGLGSGRYRHLAAEAADTAAFSPLLGLGNLEVPGAEWTRGRMARACLGWAWTGEPNPLSCADHLLVRARLRVRVRVRLRARVGVGVGLQVYGVRARARVRVRARVELCRSPA